MRAKVASIRGRSQEAGILVQHLLREPRIRLAEVRPATGSVILHFDEIAIKGYSVVTILKTALVELDQIGWRPSQLPQRQDIHDARVAPVGSIRRSLLRIFMLSGFTLFHLIKTFIFKSPLSQGWIIAGTLLGGLNLFRRALKDVKQDKFLSANIFLSGATLLATFTGESAAAAQCPDSANLNSSLNY